MTDEKQGREIVKHLASLAKLAEEANNHMAKASRVAARSAKTQEDILEQLAEHTAMLRAIAEKLGADVRPGSNNPPEFSEPSADESKPKPTGKK